MKVNTDGVLLACWAGKHIPHSLNILDIGTGTGVIAMLSAQFFPPAKIDAVDISEEAYVVSSGNFKASPWNQRLKSYHTSLQNFRPEKFYDLIITNPPFFENRFKSVNVNKNTARHTDTLSFREIVLFVKNNLNEEGQFAIILPVYEAKLFIEVAEENKLFLNKLTKVASSAKKEPHRFLMIFAFASEPNIKPDRINIYQDLKMYTEEYKALTRSFYLAF